ncbi:DUF2231 domain-containing protein [Lentzea sp. NEAU-D7]|uniref:DUF2231 domain-containing protein n=1 Tax=Lentzea sp. NEAU-D7 TaxID=2994667 RepID=UPI002B0589FF|nr:DUF2231 domain-containing protein [Lentzea sp. NEAU-D7]
MRSRARMMGHAIHPMLIVFPLGLLFTAVCFDGLYFATTTTNFAVASAYTTAAGVLGGVLAAMFGWVDWFAIPGKTRAKRVGLIHGLVNGLALALFAVSWLLRLDQVTWRPTVLSISFALGGLVLASVGGWLGGELVERLGVGVDPDAGLDASSSLRGHKRAPAA